MLAKKYEIWSEMGPYGSVGAHIKTGRSPMAQDHFKTPPDPKKGHGIIKNPKKKESLSGHGSDGKKVWLQVRGRRELQDSLSGQCFKLTLA